MKNGLLSLVLLSLVGSCNQTSKSQNVDVVPVESFDGYDSLLALETGADSYGMRRYVMALLKEGPNRDRDSTESAELQRAHMANITRMAEEGKLVVAGPFFDDWEVKGIYIFAVESIEEAEQLTNSDPAIQAGSLVMELHPWYGSAAMMKINEMHLKLTKSGS